MIAPPDSNQIIARIASAIGEPARARMLYCLLDNRARTSTELALAASVSPSTASAHLTRLKAEGLVRQVVQGKHRFYSLQSVHVAAVLEKLSVLAGAPKSAFVPTAPERLRSARTCYDHIAGALGVQLHDRFVKLSWLVRDNSEEDAYRLTQKGVSGMQAIGIDVDAARASRRRFAYACLDWSERRSHLGGSLAAAVLSHALSKKWVAHADGDRVLRVTAQGSREFAAWLGAELATDKR